MNGEPIVKPIQLKDLKEYFGYSKLADFSKDWKELTEEDRMQIKAGIADGSMTY